MDSRIMRDEGAGSERRLEQLRHFFDIDSERR
jgi:hypothetical protein